MTDSMSVEEALSLIDRALASVQADRATHVTLQTAFKVVKGATEQPVPPKS